MTGKLDSYLSVCRLGLTMTTLGLGWMMEPAFYSVLQPQLAPLGAPEPLTASISFISAFLLMSGLHLLIGEQLPRMYAIHKPERVSAAAVLPLAAFLKLMYPMIVPIEWLSVRLLRLWGIEPQQEHRIVHTEEELRVMLKESNQSGLIDNVEMALVDNIFEFTVTSAREIMIPRTEMVCLYASLPFEENRSIAISEMHTRYPVCSPDKDNIGGFVHMKDLLKLQEEDGELSAIIRPILKVPQSMQISALLKLMQKRKAQMALLIDEFGGTSGLVTFEDIIEEIVGEIQDEFDEERPRIERREDGSFSIDGRMLIEEVNSYFGLSIESDDYDTVGGWIYAQVEMPPTRLQYVEWGDMYRFAVEEIEHLRISRVTVRRLEDRQQFSDRRQVQGE